MVRPHRRPRYAVQQASLDLVQAQWLGGPAASTIPFVGGAVRPPERTAVTCYADVIERTAALLAA
jgi:hypothetical protein